MQYKKRFMLLAILMGLLITGCSSRLVVDEANLAEPPEWKLVPLEEPLNITSYATLSLEKISRTGCTVDMKNNGERIIHIGSPFTYNLQLWDGSQWNRILFIDFNHTIGGEATPLNRLRGTVDWEDLYGKLPDGTYRMVVGYSAKAHDAELDGGWERCYAVYEFEIL